MLRSCACVLRGRAPVCRAAPKTRLLVATRTRARSSSASSSKADAVAAHDGEDEHTAEEQAGHDKTTTAEKHLRACSVQPSADGSPGRWEAVLKGIQEMRASPVADFNVAGVEAMLGEKDRFAPHVTRFHVLVLAMLSSQTKEKVNVAATKRLIARGLSVAEMLAIDEKELAQLIRPVRFYNNKARYIKQVAQVLVNAAGEAGEEVVDIPDTFDALLALPGVGPKMAHLVMSCAWDNTVGICVDTHVHRVSNRLGWVKTWNKVNPKSQNPEKTRKELEKWLPREQWGSVNLTLVGFGQTVCLPRGPTCSECGVSHMCPSAFTSAI